MSNGVLFKGNIEEGSYKLIKTTDGWVLVGKDIAFAGSDITGRPQAEWIRTFDGNEWYWYCSNCKEQWYEEDLWMGGNEFPHFCPNCGAKMKGADDE